MKNIEGLLQKGDIMELEKLRKDALARQDAQAYTIISNEMGLDLSNVEDPALFEQGNLYLEKKIRKVSKDYLTPAKRPGEFFNAWNASKKVSRNDRPYKSGADFAFIETRREAREALYKMFPDQKKEIRNLNAKQAKRAYYDIRGMYFG